MKKILAMLLVIMMLATILVSCDSDEEPTPGGDSMSQNTPPDNTDPNRDDKTPTNDDDDDDETLTPDPNRIPPETKDFGGYEFKFLLDQAHENFEFQAPTVAGGDHIQKALFERNKTVERLYNVKISQKINVNGANGSYAFLDAKDRSGEYFADIYSMYAVRMINQHAVAGYYLNLHDLESLRLDQSWWDQDFLSEMTVNDHVYTMTGDIQLNEDLHEMVLSMNLKLYQDTYPEKDIYQIVSTNRAWTFDEFYSTWYGFQSSDGGTTGKVDSEDKVGYFYDNRTASYMYMAAGLKGFTVKDSTVTVNLLSDTSLRVIDYLQNILDGDTKLKAVRLDDTQTGGGYVAGNNHFAAGKALFVTNSFLDVLQYQTEMENSVVYLPFPKYSGTQDRYYSLVHMTFEPFAISANVDDAERSALITEALAYYSNTLDAEIPKLLLGDRLSSENETRKLLKLTLDSKTYDMEYTANIMGWTGTTNDMLFCGNQLDAYRTEIDALTRRATGRTGTLNLFLTAYANAG